MSDPGDGVSDGVAEVTRGGRQPRDPTMLDAVLPILALIFFLALTIAFFGIEATDGPLQVALLLSAAFASLVAFKNGYTVAAVSDAAVGGVSSAMGAIFILLAVGALIGTWNMAGTIPTLVDYGLRIVSPTWFYVTAAIVCALVGMVTGSSWTTIGTLGVAFVGIATVMGLSTAVAAGAVICGAYFGDKMTPLSETTILVPRLVGRGLTTGTHIRSMFWTAGPALALSLVVFFVLGTQADPRGGIATDEAQAVLGTAFDVGFLALLPLLLLVGFAALRLPPFLSILGSAVFAGLLAPFIQPQAVEAFVEDPDGGRFAVGVEAMFAAMASGFVSHSGVEAVDELFSRGGMSGMLSTVWLILGALSYAAVMEHAGFLQRLLAPIVTRARSRGSLILSTTASGIGLNVVAGDQYVADVLPARMFRDEYARRGLAPQVLSRTVEDAGTATSVLIPWNTCGAYVSGVLGVSTAAYLPYCIFNIASPVLSVIYGYAGFQTPSVPGGRDDGPEGHPGPGPGGEAGIGARSADGTPDGPDLGTPAGRGAGPDA